MTTSGVGPGGWWVHGPGTGTAVVGLQWGDEGKGKVVDALASEHDAIIRYNGGANAGHSIVLGGERFALHLVPAGILTPGKLAVIASGVVADVEALIAELDSLGARGVDTSGLVLSDRAHVVMPYHKDEDEARERLLAGEGQQLGTTRRGIGPCYADKVQRGGAIRVGDLLREDLLRRRLEGVCPLKNSVLRAMGFTGPAHHAVQLLERALGWGERLRGHIRDTSYLLHDLLANGKRLLFEGANATLLDVDHGTYPFVTSSSCAALGIPAGTGVPLARVGRVLGVVKAYSTRVGAGPMPTELQGDLAHRIRERGREYGTTTGRPRRVGWLDLVAVKYAAMLNGCTGLAVTLLDVLAGLEELRVCRAYRVGGTTTDRFLPDGEALAAVEPVYEVLEGFDGELGSARSLEDLPAGARRYLQLIESAVGVPVEVVGVGPERSQALWPAGGRGLA